MVNGQRSMVSVVRTCTYGYYVNQIISSRVDTYSVPVPGTGSRAWYHCEMVNFNEIHFRYVGSLDGNIIMLTWLHTYI